MDKQWTTWAELVEEQALQFRDKPAFIFLEDGESVGDVITYRMVSLRAKSLAIRLRQFCNPGDRVLLVYPSCIENIIAFFASLYAGLIAVPVCLPRRDKHTARLANIFIDCNARVALCSIAGLAEMNRFMNGTALWQASEWFATDTVKTEEATDWISPSFGTDTIAYLQYTSGSTGMPKGVAITQANLLANLRMSQHAFDSCPKSTLVTWLPAFHDLGLVCQMLHAYYVGSTCVFMPPLSFVQQPVRWLKAMSKYRAEVSAGPDFSYRVCEERIPKGAEDELDLSSWRVAINGAEPVRQSTIERFAARFARCGFRKEAFYPAYGMAEATALVSGGKWDSAPVYLSVDRDQLRVDRVVEKPNADPTTVVLVGCGRTILEQEIAIVDPTTLRRCPDGYVGEIWIAGRSVGRGYWNQPEISNRTFNVCLVDEKERPFMRTGDLGFLHQEELFITGRIKDIIIIHGVKHYPQDIEEAAEKASSAVRPSGVAAFSMSGETGEHVVVVAEVQETHHKTALRQLTALIRQSVADICEVTVYDIILLAPSTLPRTTSGKMERHRCRSLYLSGSLQVHPYAEHDEAEQMEVLAHAT